MNNTHFGTVSPASGTVLEVLVSVDQMVAEGQELAIIESMKMEIPLTAPAAGMVQAIMAEPGGQVREGDICVQIVTE